MSCRNRKVKCSRVLSILGVALLLSMLSTTSVGAFANTNMAANYSRQAAIGSLSEMGLGDPVPANIYLNGSIDSGIMSFNARPGSESIIFEIAFPWASYPSISQNSNMVVSFAIYPFPAQSAIPSWVHVTVSAPSLKVPYGESSSINLLITVDSTAPQTGTIGSFEIGSHYTDPVTGLSETTFSVIRLNAGTPITTTNSPISNSAGGGPDYQLSTSSSVGQLSDRGHGTGKDPSCAIGVGLCDSSAKTQCNNNGISWSSVTAVSSGISYPSLSPSAATFFTVNANIAPNMFLQITLLNPYGGSHNWEVDLFYNDCSTNPCNYYNAPITGEGSSGSTTIEILYSSGWQALVGANQWPFASWISQCCPSSTAFNSKAQEPFAFESYSTTQSDFSGMSNVQSPSFEYYLSGSWSNPPTGIVVNSNDGPANSGSWPNIPVGGGVATPTWFLEGGHSQCSSVSSPNVDIGDTGYVCSGATNTYGTALF